MKKNLKILFVLYIIILGLLLFNRGIDYSKTTYITYNLIPFATIKRYLFILKGGDIFLFTINIIGNVIVFIPFGFFIPRLFTKLNKYIYMILIALLIPIVIEVTQLVLSVGIMDIDDLILNFIGIIVGYYIFRK